MGYRSSWAFVVHSEDDKKLLDFESWLVFKGKDSANYSNTTPKVVEDLERYKLEGLFTYFFKQKDIDKSYPVKKGYITFLSDNTKCYDTWERMMRIIMECCDDNSLEWDYLRIGDDLADIEHISGCDEPLLRVATTIEFDF